MAKFRSAKELEAYKKNFTIVSCAHKAVLIHPMRHVISGEFDPSDPLREPKLAPETICEVPADQVQHYLDKGFKWSKS